MDFRPLIDENLKTMDPSLFQEQWGGLKEIINAKRKDIELHHMI